MLWKLFLYLKYRHITRELNLELNQNNASLLELRTKLEQNIQTKKIK